MGKCYNASGIFLSMFNILSLILRFSLPILAAAGLLAENRALAQKGVAITSYAVADYKDYKKSSHTSPEWDPFVQEGFEALDRQDTQSTIEFLRKAVGLGCQSPLVYFKLGLSYEALGSHYSAVQYYEQAKAQFAKSNTDHRYNRTFDENYGRALDIKEKKKKSLPILEQAAKKSDSFWLLKLLGQMAHSKGDHLSATAYFERALRSADPDLTPEEKIYLTLQLARIYGNRNETDGAKRYYEKVLELDPNNQEARDYLGRFKQDNTYDKIFEILEKH